MWSRESQGQTRTHLDKLGAQKDEWSPCWSLSPQTSVMLSGGAGIPHHRAKHTPGLAVREVEGGSQVGAEGGAGLLLASPQQGRSTDLQPQV